MAFAAPSTLHEDAHRLLDADGASDELRPPGRARLSAAAAFAAAAVVLLGATAAACYRVHPRGRVTAALGVVRALEDSGNMVSHVDQSTLMHNNLGNMGPQKGTEPTVVLSSIGTTSDGSEVTLTISNLTKYLPTDDAAAGQNGRGASGDNPFGFINVKCGTESRLKFALSDQQGAPLKIGKFALSFFDLDSGNKGQVKEYMGVVTDFVRSQVAEDTELVEDDLPGGGKKWTSSVPGNGKNNPTDPKKLTPDQQKRAVSIEFADKDSIEVVFGATNNDAGYCRGGRNLMFSFQWSLPPVPLVCNIASSKVVNNNLGNMGPQIGNEPTIVLEEFGNYGGKSVTLKIRNLTRYQPKDEHAAGANGRGVHGTNPFGFLNVKCGTEAKLRFEYYIDGELAPMDVVPLTFLDLDTGNKNEVKEYAGVYDTTPFAGKYLLNKTELVESEQNGVTVFTATQIGNGRLNPKDPESLTRKQKKEAVQMVFRGASHIDLLFGATNNDAGNCNGGRNLMFACLTNLASISETLQQE